MAYKYRIFFNGVLHGEARGKGEALDKAYGVVNFAQMSFARNAKSFGERGYDVDPVVKQAEDLSLLMGYLANVIPTVRRERNNERVVLKVEKFGASIVVRRDAA